MIDYTYFTSISTPAVSRLRRIYKTIIYICLIGFISCFFSIKDRKLSLFENYSEARPLNWIVTSKSESFPLSLPFSNNYSSDTFSIKAKLPEINPSDIIFLNCVFSNIDVYINKNPIFHSELAKIGKHNTSLGRTFCIIPLDPLYSNQDIEICINIHPRKHYKSTLSRIILTSRNSFLLQQLKENLLLIIFSIILLITSVCSMLFVLLGYFSNKKRISKTTKALLCLSEISILSIIWAITDSHLFTYFTGYFVLNNLITYISLLILPISFSILFQSLYGDSSISFSIIRRISELNFIIQFVLFYFGIFDLPQMLFLSHILYFLETCFGIIFGFFQIYKKNTSEKIILYIGNTFFGITIAFVITRYIINRDSDYAHYFLIPLIVFCFMQIAVCISRFIKTIRKQAALREAEKYAYTDPMTKLSNRRAYGSYKDKLLADKLPENLNLIIVDINGLKNINDTLGHKVGDELIITVADIIQKVFYDSQINCRMGGDEFLIIMNSDKNTVKKRLFLFQSQIKGYKSLNLRNISVSYGYSSSLEHPDYTFEELFESADKFMYEMKLAYHSQTTNQK